MKEAKGNPPPTSASLEELLADFRPSDSQVKGIKKPSGKVKVSKRGHSLDKLKSVFKIRKKEQEPNCARSKNIKISGSSMKTLCIDCGGCRFRSDLLDSECRLRCVKLLGEEYCEKLVLDNGFYKKEYGPADTRKLKELHEIADGLVMQFPEECGLCAKEHDRQVERLKEEIMRDPARLLSRGVEVSENPEITVKGVEREICAGCRKRTEDKVGKTFLRLQSSSLSKSYSFTPMVRPFFSNSRILFELPEKSRIEDSYDSNGAKVVLSRGDEEVYSIFPPEYKLSRQQLEVMKLAYGRVVERASSQEGGQFMDLCKSQLVRASSEKGYDFPETELSFMAASMVRCTRGLDVIELLLKDVNLNDVYINSPIDSTPVYVKHREFGDCRTNVYLTEQTARNIISKFRLMSGRAFSEVSPVLDMELPEFGVRVNITGPPVSPDGLAFAFRRASEEPWTLLRFIENRMISPLAAGLLALMVNEESTILMCGDRGSGKTSMLTALIGAMPTKHRILTMEDTFEIPAPVLAKKGGFRIQRMRIKPSTASKDSFELGADDAMRSLLRMGDSAIVMGEVRGREARTLYEAMNVGGSGNCVLGTIHGKSPRSLLERVVFSLGVPPQSFKATDLVVIADRIRPGGGSRRLRRVTRIVEVGKRWTEPEADEVFSDLMTYDRETDELVASDNLENPHKSEVIGKIAEKRGAGPEDILEDIRARAKAYGHVVRLSGKSGDKRLLSMKTMVGLNQRYLQLVDESIRLRGGADYDYVAEQILGWIDDYAQNKVKIEIVSNDGLCGAVQEVAQDIQKRSG